MSNGSRGALALFVGALVVASLVWMRGSSPPRHAAHAPNSAASAEHAPTRSVDGRAPSRAPRLDPPVPLVARATPSGDPRIEFASRGAVRVRLDREGAHIDTQHADLPRLDLRLARHGCEGAMRATEATAPVAATPTRAAFEHVGVREWYELRGSVVEQGFDVSRDPACDGRAMRLELDTAEVALRDAGDAVEVTTRSGAVAARIAELHVFDADHHAVSARFEVRGDRLAIAIDSVGARFPLVVDPLVIGAQQMLIDHVGYSADSDGSGYATLVDANVAFVSAPSGGAGLVYVLRRTGGAWALAQVLRPSDGVVGDRFGHSLAYSGDTLVVGARERASAASTGAAYVFVETGGTFAESAILTPTSTDFVDDFAEAVALEGDVLAVQGRTFASGLSELVYVFRRTAGAFAQTQAIVNPNAQGSEFGQSLALSGATLAVGAPLAIPMGMFSPGGEVVLFTDTAGTFGAPVTVGTASTFSNGRFGQAVALDANALVVGALYDQLVGRVYVFSLATPTPTPVVTLAPPSALGSVDRFGAHVRVSGSRVLVGTGEGSAAEFDASNSFAVVRAEAHLTAPTFPGGLGLSDTSVLVTLGGTPAQIVDFVPDTTEYVEAGRFDVGNALALGAAGRSVATDATSIIVASSAASPVVPTSDGVAHVYQRMGSTFVQEAILHANSTGTGFGSSAAIDSDWAYVGQAAVGSPGSVAAFNRDTSGAAPVWQAYSPLTSPNSQTGDGFGTAISLRGGYLAVTAPLDDVATLTDAGRVYVYQVNGASRTLRAQLAAPDATTSGELGSAVAVDDTTLAVAGPGGLYASMRSGITWTPLVSLESIDCTSCSVAVSGNLVVVGAYTAGSAKNAGQLRAYRFATGAWTLIQTFAAADTTGYDYLGRSLALESGVLFAGAPGDDETLSNVGTVRTFVFDGSVFVEDGVLRAGNGLADDAFGTSVAARGTTWVAGAPGVDFAEPVGAVMQTSVGTAYVASFARGDGMGCSDDGSCNSGYCVDGVCCNVACDRTGSNRCSACTIAAGGSANGTCTPRAATTVCRTAAGLCDVAETCDGTTSVCPPDTLSSPTSICRASAGPCDVADTCTGSSAVCPVSDVKVTAGTTCRPSVGACDSIEVCNGTDPTCPGDAFQNAGVPCRTVAGVCDVEEQCTGASAACPADAFVSSGTSCRAVANMCDVAESCTGSAAACPIDGFVANGLSCDDGLTCTQTSSCQAGVCAPALTLDCSDGNGCTTDTCIEPTGCTHTTLPVCSLDAGTDSGSNPGVDGSVAPGAATGGCSCRVVPASRPAGAGPWILALLALAVARARRPKHATR